MLAFRLALVAALVVAVRADDMKHDTSGEEHEEPHEMDHHAEDAHSGAHPSTFSTNYQNVAVLFDGWSAMSPIEYTLTIIAMICFGIGAESVVVVLRRIDARLDLSAPIPFGTRVLRSVVYGLHTSAHFMLMLAAMTFDVGIFVAIMAGFTLGYFAFSSGVHEPSTGHAGHHAGGTKPVVP